MKKNIKIFIFSFLFAFALWLYINLNLSYSLDLTIPLEVQALKSQALSEEIPGVIDVKVKGKGWDLLNVLISKNQKYSLDITRLHKDSKIITEQLINERLNLQPNLSILEITPDTININFDKLSEKVVPVRNNILLNLKDGYTIIGKPKLSPDSVKIEGASYVISKIKWVPTETKILNNINSNVSGIIIIKDTLSNLIKIGQRQISYNYTVQLSAEKDFDDIDVNVLNVPEDKEVLLIPPKVNVSLRGGVEQLTQINLIEIQVYVEFKKIENDTLGYVIPDLSTPEETILLKVVPQKLQYIIKNKF